VYHSLILVLLPEGPGEVPAEKVQLPSVKRARSIPLRALGPREAHVRPRTRSQSRSVVGPGPALHLPHPLPPTIVESPLAPPESSPLSSEPEEVPEEVPGMCMADILQDHVLEY
jgi:hypothetical protein